MGRVRVISVTSGKGGVGKSHLAANLATLCAREQRVLLIDADAGLANVDVLLGAKPQRHLGDLLAGANLDDVLCEVRPGLTLLAGAPGERKLAQLDDDSRRILACSWEILVGRFDVIVVDVGSGVGDDVLFFTSAGDMAVLVTTEEPTSISDAAVLLHQLRAKTSVREVQVVVNGVRTSRSAQAVFARLHQASLESGVRLSLLANVPDDQNLRRAAMVGRPLVELAPTSPASRAFERLTQTLLTSPVGAPAGGAWLTEAHLAKSA